MRIHAGFQTLDFYQVFEFPKLLNFATREDALNWLKHLLDPHPHLIFRFREYLIRYSGDQDSSLLTDYQTIERLAVLLYSRRIVVIARESGSGGGQPMARPETLAPPFPLSDRKPRPVQSSKSKTWISIELKDDDGNPVAGEDYKLELPDGRIVQGKLDRMGTAGVSGIDPGQCRVSFPRLDGSEWTLVGNRAE